MREARGHLDFTQEALGADVGGDFGLEHLERDVAVVPQVVGEEDDGHAAFAERAVDGVAAAQAGLEALLQCGQGRGRYSESAWSEALAAQ